MYYFNMETLLSETKNNKVIISGDIQYFYTVNPFEVANALGTAVATLQEYSISNINGENYKIYKTKEGNWYDLAEVNSNRYNLLLISLKSAIDLQESCTQYLF